MSYMQLCGVCVCSGGYNSDEALLSSEAENTQMMAPHMQADSISVSLHHTHKDVHKYRETEKNLIDVKLASSVLFLFHLIL